MGLLRIIGAERSATRENLCRHGIQCITAFLCLLLFCLAGTAAMAAAGNRELIGRSGDAKTVLLTSWRFYTSQDGMMESWVNSVNLAPNGDIYITNGEVTHMNVYDGYTMRRLPSPGNALHVAVSPDGDGIWAEMTQGPVGFLRYRKSTWDERRITTPDLMPDWSSASRDTFVPLSKDDLLYTIPDALVHFNFPSGSTSVVIDAEQAGIGEFRAIAQPVKGGVVWITGAKGIGSFVPDKGGDLRDGRWTAYPAPASLDAVNFERPVIAAADTIFLAAKTHDNIGIAAAFESGKWRTMMMSDRVSITAGWPDREGTEWFLATSSPDNPWFDMLYRKTASSLETPQDNRILSSVIHDFELCQNGHFFIASTMGLASYCPLSWRPPLGVPDVRQLILSCGEDAKGRMYFATADSLYVVAENTLENYPLREYTTHTSDICCINGRKMLIGGNGNRIVVFDSETKRFEYIQRPGLRAVMRIVKRDENSAWIYSQNRVNGFRIETYDGSEFKTVLDNIDFREFGMDIKTIHQSKNGDIWFLDVRDLVVYRDGEMMSCKGRDGCELDGAFCIIERRDGSIWVGGRDIIQSWDGEKWRTIRTERLETMRSMIELDDGAVLTGSATGIKRYKEGVWIGNDWNEGLPDATVHIVYQQRNGKIWAFSSRGVRTYHPGADTESPETFIPDEGNARRIAPDGQGMIRFSGIDRWKQTQRHRLLYSWRIDRGPWSPYKVQSSAMFDGLSCGGHRMEVRCMDRAGNVDESPAVYSFYVLLPWYREPGFLVALILSGVFAIISLAYGISRQFRLEKLVRARTQKLADATESLRRESEEKMSLTEKYRVLYQTSRDAIALSSPEGRIIDVNNAWLDLFGMTRKESINGDITRIYYSPEDRAMILDMINQFGFLRDYEIGYRTWDGREITCLLSSNAHRDNDGTVLYYQSVFHDITERKRLENQLTQAQKMESIGRLAGGVAHDFNNMLNVIIGHTELVLNDIDSSDPHYETFSEIKIAANRSADLTRQLLAYARKQTVIPRKLDLDEVVTTTLKMLRRIIGEDIELVWKPGGPLAPIMMDPAQIDQMLANLCVNARDAISGTGRISIETGAASFGEDYCCNHAELRPGDFVMLAVSDNGCGMEKDMLDTIFEPFYTTKAIGEGTGLGLATVYGIVKQNDGFINVYSEVGEGTTFRIYIPVSKDAPAAQTAAPPPQEETPHGNETILVVEDDKSNLRMCTRLLERLGYNVLAAPLPEEAYKLAEEHEGKIDLLLCDVIMPGQNGRQVAEKIRGMYPHIKQVFMSGYTADVIANRGFVDESRHFIQKPFSLKDLGAMVRKVLDGTPGAES